MKRDSRKLQTCRRMFYLIMWQNCSLFIWTFIQKICNVWAVDHADEGKAFFCLGDQINIPENGGARCLLFAIVLPPRHRPEEEYTLIYVLNELNLGQNRDEENSLVFKAMRRAWRCQGHEHITQSVVHRIMAAATASDDEVLKIALLPQRFQGAVDFAESILPMNCAISSHSWATHWVSTLGLSSSSTALVMESSSMFLPKMRGTALSAERCSVRPKWNIDILSLNAESRTRFFQVQAIKTGHISIIYPQTVDILSVSCTSTVVAKWWMKISR